jgi:serine protease inhibitor
MLSSWLRSLGVTEIFDPSTADLSGIARHESAGRSEPLHIDEIIHRSFSLLRFPISSDTLP